MVIYSCGASNASGPLRRSPRARALRLGAACVEGVAPSELPALVRRRQQRRDLHIVDARLLIRVDACAVEQCAIGLNAWQWRNSEPMQQ